MRQLELRLVRDDVLVERVKLHQHVGLRDLLPAEGNISDLVCTMHVWVLAVFLVDELVLLILLFLHLGGLVIVSISCEHLEMMP